jgi:(2Fe-2S) ferredoxin
MEKPGKHVFVCASFRAGGEPQGVCHKKGSTGLLQYLQEGLNDRDLNDVMVSATGCLNVCDRGPAIVVYPDNVWYGNITGEEAIDEILDAMAAGGVAEKYRLA